jgi:hypothetical protein
VPGRGSFDRVLTFPGNSASMLNCHLSARAQLPDCPISHLEMFDFTKNSITPLCENDHRFTELHLRNVLNAYPSRSALVGNPGCARTK